MTHAAGHIDPPAIDITTWMNQSNTSNPLDNLARVSAKLATVLAEVLNLQKVVVEEIASKIDVISKLNARVKAFTNNADSKPTAQVILGKTYEESLEMLTQMKAMGVKNLDNSINAVVALKIPLITDNAFISQVSLELQALSEAEQNRSQQESLRLQTFTNRYTQANDQASSVIQKDGQGKGSVATNLRGSGG